MATADRAPSVLLISGEGANDDDNDTLVKTRKEAKEKKKRERMMISKDNNNNRRKKGEDQEEEEEDDNHNNNSNDNDNHNNDRQGEEEEEEGGDDDDATAVITPFAVIRSIIIDELEKHAKERKRSARHRITRHAMHLLQRGVEAHAVDLFRMAGKVRQLQKQSTLRVQAFAFARGVVERKNIIV